VVVQAMAARAYGAATTTNQCPACRTRPPPIGSARPSGAKKRL